MSRIGKVPVQIPKDAKINVEAGTLRIEGAKGKLSLAIPHGIKVEQKDGQVVVTREANTKQYRASHGATRANIANCFEGVTKGHRKELELQGLGFRAQLQGNKVLLNLGLSHPFEYPVPADVKVQVPTQTSIIIEGSDKCLVGEVAAQLRRLKPAEPYKGKGFRYVGEYIRRKQGKSVTKK